MTNYRQWVFSFTTIDKLFYKRLLSTRYIPTTKYLILSTENFAIIMKQNNKPVIVAISGSLRSNSSNNTVIQLAAELLKEKAEVIIYNGLGQLPHFDDSKEPNEAVTAFRKILKESDGVLICSPEYAFGVPGSLKNALDWTVSSGELVYKPLALITAATGGDKAHAALLNTFTALSTNVTEDTSLLISYIRSKMNAEGMIIDTTTIVSIKNVTNALLELIKTVE